MGNIRIHLSSGEKLDVEDKFIEEIDDVLDRIRQQHRPFWMTIGDSLVFTGAVSAFEIT